jgi:hypothetical protein
MNWSSVWSAYAGAASSGGCHGRDRQRCQDLLSAHLLPLSTLGKGENTRRPGGLPAGWTFEQTRPGGLPALSGDGIQVLAEPIGTVTRSPA